MKGGGSVRGMVISRKAYTEVKACWEMLVHAVNLLSKPEYRRAQKTTNTCHSMQNAGYILYSLVTSHGNTTIVL